MKALSLSGSLHVATLALLLAVGLGVSTGACSRQSEGERCSPLNGNQDCDGGLVCTPANELRGGDDGVDRCCPAEESSDTDPRCLPRVGGITGTGGTTSGGGEGGQGGAGGAN